MGQSLKKNDGVMRQKENASETPLLNGKAVSFQSL